MEDSGPPGEPQGGALDDEPQQEIMTLLDQDLEEDDLLAAVINVKRA